MIWWTRLSPVLCALRVQRSRVNVQSRGGEPGDEAKNILYIQGTTVPYDILPPLLLSPPTSSFIESPLPLCTDIIFCYLGVKFLSVGVYIEMTGCILIKLDLHFNFLSDLHKPLVPLLHNMY